MDQRFAMHGQGPNADGFVAWKRRAPRVRRRWWGLALVVALLPGMLGPFAAHPAAAGISSPGMDPPPLLNIPTGVPASVQIIAGPPPISTIYMATTDEAQALSDLEAQAVTNTIKDHGVDPSDAAAVLSWGRADAEAELWGLLLKALTTQPASRSADQQGAVHWLLDVFERENKLNAQAAGLEYARWAGLDQGQYQQLLDSGASQSDLQTFLSAQPKNYNLIGPNGETLDSTTYQNSTAGYCVYHPLAPYDTTDQYNGRDDQTCPGPCPTVLGCTPPYPTFDQFIQWGQADINSQLFNSFDFAQTAARASIGIVMGTGFAGLAGTAFSYGALKSVGTLLPDAIQKVMFPFASRVQVKVPARVFVRAAQTSYVVKDTQTTANSTEAAAEAAADTAVDVAEIGSAATLAGVASVAAIALDAIATAVLQGIQVGNAAALPGKLATLARQDFSLPPALLASYYVDPNPGPAGISNAAAQIAPYYSIFLAVTVPNPISATCANTTLPADGGPIPCLNAPAVPDPATADPIFKVTPRGSSTATPAASITWVDVGGVITTTARLHETWFIDQMSADSLPATTLQTLRLHYTDWNGAEQTAFLVNDPTQGYMFLSVADPTASSPAFNPTTCQTDGTCAYTASIDYVGADGNDYAASVIPAAPPVVAIVTGANPMEGGPVTFDASTSTSPLGLPLTYQWRFEPVNLTSISVGGCVNPSGCDPYAGYTTAVSGTTASYTWPRSGAFHVVLTATDSIGKATTLAQRVMVADVPPVLTLDPAPSSDPNCFVTLPCFVPSVPPGSPSTIAGTITHAGRLDTERVWVNWGDGSAQDHDVVNPDPFDDPSDFGPFPPQLKLTDGVTCVVAHGTPTCENSDTQLTVSDTHTYAAPGAYTVTVKVSDQSGASSTMTTTELVQAPTAVTWAAPAAITYGTPLGAAQLDASAGAPGTASVPGTYAYTVHGKQVSAGDNTVLPAGSYTLQVHFTPSDPSRYTPPSAVSVPLTVNPAPLTIGADNQHTVYGQALPPFTVAPHGLVNGDTMAALAGTLNVATMAGQASPPGTYALTPSGLSSPNYSITFAAGTLTIAKDSTTVTLSSSAPSASFGQAVTLTASVIAAAPGSGMPTGTLTFLDGGMPIGTATLQNGQASLSSAALLGGTHTLTVGYGGDANFTSGTSAALAQAITFNRTLSGTMNGPQTIQSGEAVLINGTVNGPLTVRAGGAVALAGAHVSGPLQASGALSVAVCGSTVIGPLNINGTTGLVRLGAGRDDTGVSCAGDTLQGPLNLSGNLGDVEIEGTKITGPLRLTNTAGEAPGEDSAAPELEGNTINGPLSCSGNNTPAPTADGQPNTVSGPKSGKCNVPGM